MATNQLDANFLWPPQRQREAAAGSPDSDMGLWWGGPLEVPSPGGAQLQTIADHSGQQQEDAESFRTPQRGAGNWVDSEGEEDWGPEPPPTGASFIYVQGCHHDCLVAVCQESLLAWQTLAIEWLMVTLQVSSIVGLACKPQPERADFGTVAAMLKSGFSHMMGNCSSACNAAASWGQRASHYMRVLIPGLAGSLVQLAEALSSRPVVAAVALAAFALASPSVLAAGACACPPVLECTAGHLDLQS